MLYQPTSPQIKFKAKAWIDIFGSRLAKAVGALLNEVNRGEGRGWVGVVAMFISLALLALSRRIGGEFQILVRKKEVVGGGGVEDRGYGLEGDGDEGDVELEPLLCDIDDVELEGNLIDCDGDSGKIERETVII